MTSVPQWNGQPITQGWWWLEFPDGPGPRYWDGTFWDRGSGFVAVKDYANYPIRGPCPTPDQLATRERMIEAAGQNLRDALSALEIFHETLEKVSRDCRFPNAADQPPVADPGARNIVIGRVTAQPRAGNQCPGMPGAICHACGIGWKCFDPDCPNDTYAPDGALGFASDPAKA